MRLRRDFAVIAMLTCSMTGNAFDGKQQPSASDSARFSSPSIAASDQRTRFAGTYRYAGDSQEEEARKAAIDHAVEGLSFVIRSAARGRITATTQILQTYSFSFEPGKIVVRPQSRPEMISGDKGEPADYIYKGKTSRFTQLMVGDRITQVFTSDDGKRENEFTLSKDGNLLRLKVTLTSPRLSNPVVYALSYKKTD